MKIGPRRNYFVVRYMNYCHVTYVNQRPSSPENNENYEIFFVENFFYKKLNFISYNQKSQRQWPILHRKIERLIKTGRGKLAINVQHILLYLFLDVSIFPKRPLVTKDV